MNKTNTSTALFTAVLLLAAISMPLGYASAAPQLPAAIAKSIGTVKTINGNILTLAPSSGPEVTVTVQQNARILKLGADKDPKNAAAIQLSDVQVGDSIRARGAGSADGKSISALEIIVITSSALASVSDQMRQDWQKRGIAGIVSAVDPPTGAVTISIPSLADKKSVTIHTNSGTKIHRYAADSAKSEDATTIPLQGILVNDQLRVRGNRSADGSEISAEEIYTGVFPQFTGTIKSIDASAGTLSVQDLVTKRIVQLRVNADSQLHHVPADTAQRMAAIVKRFKQGGANGPAPAAPAAAGSASSPAAVANPLPPGAGAPGPGGPGAGGTGPRAGAGGLQRMLDSTPTTTLADLHKGDALAILATEGTASSGGSIISLYSGVEPILEAAPNAMMLTPWSLGGAPGGGDQ